jgi:pseudouridine-5'-phosphate glycosidase
VKHIRQAGRATMGTHLINLKEGDTVASVARLSVQDLAPVTGEQKNGQAEAASGLAEAASELEVVVPGGNGAQSPDGAEDA